MKRIFIVLLAVMVLFSSASLAEDLSSLSDNELMELYRKVTDEMADRGIPFPEEVRDGMDPDGGLGENAWNRLMAFLNYWSCNMLDGMLALCSPDWKAKTEDPGMELFRILANRTPVSAEVNTVSGEASDTVRTVTVTALIDRNNGKEPALYLLRVTIKKEADGLWYVDPESLMNIETAEGGPQSGTVPEIPGSMVLWYNPEGGQYYHADQNCQRVNARFLPLSGTFTYDELDDERYRDLKPCAICGAPVRREIRPVSADFRGAVDAAGELVSVGGDIDYLSVAMEKNGMFLRMVTLLDDHARMLYMDAMTAGDSGEAFDAFQAYAWSLPVSYTEEITAKPKEQAELDAQAGKTVGELLEEGYSLYGSGGGVNLPIVIDLSYGLFNYEFEVDAAFEEYLECRDRDDLESLKLKSGEFSGFSGAATDLDYLSDGAFAPQVVPHITGEEASAVRSVPPAEEYTGKAWPLTAEGYADLLNNIEARYGQVYMVEGIVHQVLSLNPLRIIVNTGEDGKSQPVVVEFPEQLGFSWEAGSSFRIYADVSSACFILPVLTARYCFTVPAETVPAENNPSAAAWDIAADKSFIYSSAGYYVILAEKDGAWWRMDVQVDDRYGEMYSSVLDAADPGAAYNEMEAYVRTLPMASAEKLGEQPLSKDVLDNYVGKRMKDLLADGFGFDFSQGFTGDESKADGNPEILRPTDDSGSVYRVPFYLMYTDPEFTDGLLFRMNMGIYSYQFSFDGTEDTLKEAIRDGTWGEMEITDEVSFTGFSFSMEQSLMGDINARRFPTKEEAAGIRTVRDALKYDFIGFYSDDFDEYRILINGTDCFWLATAKLDDRYRELTRAARGGNEDAENELMEYESSLPVTVKAVEGEHPPIPDMSAYIGKTIGELQAEGFDIFWFYATTEDPAKEEYNKILSLPGAGGQEITVNGFFSYDDYSECCMLDMALGMYQYVFSFEGNAESLEAAIGNGTFLDLAVREMTYSGISDHAITVLGLL